MPAYPGALRGARHSLARTDDPYLAGAGGENLNHDGDLGGYWRAATQAALSNKRRNF